MNPYVGPPFLDAIDAVQQSASFAATNKSRATIKQTHVCSPVPIDLFDYNLYIPISAQSLRSLLSGAYLSFTIFFEGADRRLRFGKLITSCFRYIDCNTKTQTHEISTHINLHFISASIKLVITPEY